MHQFPVILIPPEVQRIALSKPVVPEFNIELPSSPSLRQPRTIHIQEAISLTMGLVVVVALVTVVANAKELGIILLIVGSIAIIFRIRSQFQTYKRRYERHQATLERYLKKLEAYSHQEIKYQRDLAIAHAPERILEFRHDQFRKFFAKLPPKTNGLALNNGSNNGSNLFGQVKPTDEQATEGIIYYFGIALQQHLSGTLYQGMTLYIASIDYECCPALTYIDPALNLHIAIEISLPSENAAILMRNDLAARFLVDSGWIIIKFSQEQILQSSAECCKEFAKLLDRLSLDPSVLPSFRDTPELVPIKR